MIYLKIIMLIAVVVFDIIVINIILNIRFPDCLDFYWNDWVLLAFVFNIQLYFAFVELSKELVVVVQICMWRVCFGFLGTVWDSRRWESSSIAAPTSTSPPVTSIPTMLPRSSRASWGSCPSPCWPSGTCTLTWRSQVWQISPSLHHCSFWHQILI